MILQTHTALERATQTFHNVTLLGGERIWVGGVECWPQFVEHFVLLAVDGYGSTFLVDGLHETAVHHVPLGVCHSYLTRQFELYDRDCLVHLRNETHILLGKIGAFRIYSRLIYFTWIIGILLHGECCQRYHVDCIAIFKSLCIGIAQRQTEYTGNTACVTGCSTHPQDIVVTPCYIHMVIVAQGIHYAMCTGATVKDIAKNMQTVYYQTLYEITECCDEMPCTACSDDCLDNYIEIGLFVLIVVCLMQKFLNDVGILLGEAFAHL